MRSIHMTAPAVAVVTLLAGACGSSGTASTQPPPSSPAAGTLVVSKFTFSAVTGAVAGTPVTIENKDAFKHTVTADDKTFDVALDPNGTAKLTVDKAGTYSFHCEIHPSMKGSLTVG